MSSLYGSISGMSGILSIRISESHSSPSATAIIECENHSVDLGDEINIDLGYVGDSDVVFNGYVKLIEQNIPENTYNITLNDKMTRAIDYFIASSDPDSPFSRSNISAEDLVGDVFSLANLNSYEYETSYFTFGINNPVEVNLESVYDFNNRIATLLAYHIWCDNSGTVHFKRRMPYIMDGDTYTHEISASEILEEDYSVSEKDLRNRVVVYGNDGVYAEASAVSPYLPTDFYKSVVYASSILVQTNDMAQTIADYNLDKLNRLTESMSINIVGRTDISARDIIRVTPVTLSIGTLDWYVYAIEQSFESEGFTTTLELRK